MKDSRNYHNNMIVIFEISEYNIYKEMIYMSDNAKNIKYTAVLPIEYINELKELALKKIIPSVNFGIRLAIENYICERKRDLYKKQMKEAAKDDAFLKRTLETQAVYDLVDNEVDGQKIVLQCASR